MLKIITSCPTSNDPPFLPSSLLPPQTLTWDDLPTYLGDVLPLSVETPGSDCVWSPPPRTGRIARACGEGGPESCSDFSTSWETQANILANQHGERMQRNTKGSLLLCCPTERLQGCKHERQWIQSGSDLEPIQFFFLNQYIVTFFFAYDYAHGYEILEVK